MHKIYNWKGETISTSKNLRGIRRHVGKNSVRYVTIKKINKNQGYLYIQFYNCDSFKITFASYEVLKQTIRNWKNLKGVPVIEG